MFVWYRSVFLHHIKNRGFQSDYRFWVCYCDIFDICESISMIFVLLGPFKIEEIIYLYGSQFTGWMRFIKFLLLSINRLWRTRHVDVVPMKLKCYHELNLMWWWIWQTMKACLKKILHSFINFTPFHHR